MKNIQKKLVKNAHKKIKKQSKEWKFERLEVIAYLNTPVFLQEDIFLDGLLYHEQIRHWMGPYFYNSVGKVDDFFFNMRLPVKQAKFGVYLASKGFYDDKCVFISRTRKRFDDLKGEKYIKPIKSKIRTNAGKYKNTDIPLKLVSTDKISWVVIGDKQAIRKLVNNIACIGKKTSQGYGLVKEWRIIPTNKKGIRIFPLEGQPREWMKVKYSRYIPSYYNMNNLKMCYESTF
jgi:hypothetical protein